MSKYLETVYTGVTVHATDDSKTTLERPVLSVRQQRRLPHREKGTLILYPTAAANGSSYSSLVLDNRAFGRNVVVDTSTWAASRHLLVTLPLTSDARDSEFALIIKSTVALANAQSGDIQIQTVTGSGDLLRGCVYPSITGGTTMARNRPRLVGDASNNKFFYAQDCLTQGTTFRLVASGNTWILTGRVRATIDYVDDTNPRIEFSNGTAGPV